MHVYCQHCNQRESDSTMTSSGRTLRWDAFITCLPEQGSTQLALAPRFKSFPSRKADKSSSACFIHLLFQCFRFWNLMCLKSMDLQICSKTPFGLKIFSFDMTKWLGVKSPGVISNTGEFRGILSKVREPQIFWTVEVPKTPPCFSCHFPMFGLLFWFQIFAPKQSQVWKTQKEASCFLVMLHYNKKHVHEVFCLFLFAFRYF